MLLNDFFKVSDISVNGQEYAAEIEINPDHEIFTGHFPGNPVTPGVIILKIIHELLEKFAGRKLKMISMVKCKFLKTVHPLGSSPLKIKMKVSENSGLMNIIASGEKDGETYFKINSCFE